MDPLSIAASVAGLVAFAGKLGFAIQDCIAKVKTADGTLRSFKSELELLARTFSAIGSVLKQSNLQDAFRKVASSGQMAAQLSSLDAILKDCTAPLEQLDALLQEVNKNGHFASGILHKPVAAWRLNSSSPEIGSIQGLIKTYNGAVQVHLLLLNLLVTTDTTPAIQNIDQSLSDIRAQILQLRFSSQHMTDLAHITHSKTIKQSLQTSESILSSASEYLGSTAGTVRDNATFAQINEYSGDQVTEWLEQSHGDDLDMSLLSNLVVIAEEHFDREEFADAKRFFIKFIEKTKAVGDHTSDLVGAQLKLAYVYINTNEYAESESVLESIDAAQCNPEQTLELKQSLAEIKLALNSNLEQAKIYAREAASVRSKAADRKPYFYCIDLLAAICTRMGEDEEATAYRRLLPADFKQENKRSESAEHFQTTSRVDNTLKIPRAPSPDAKYGLDRSLSSGDSIAGETGPRKVRFMAISPSGARLISCEYGSTTADLWHVQSWRLLRRLECSMELQTVAYSREGTRIAAASSTKLFVWDAVDHTLLMSTTRYDAGLIKRSLRDINYVDFPNNASLVCSNGDKKNGILIWDIPTGKVKLRVNKFTENGHCLFFTCDATCILVSTDNKTVIKLSIANPTTSEVVCSHRMEGLTAWMDMSPNERLLVECDFKGDMQVFDMESQQRLLSPPSIGFVSYATFSSDGKRILSSRDGSSKFHIWDLGSGQLLQTIQAAGPVYDTDTSVDKRYIAYKTEDKIVHVMDISRWMYVV